MYTCTCVFKLPEPFRNFYLFKWHSKIDVRVWGAGIRKLGRDHIVCAVGRI